MPSQELLNLAKISLLDIAARYELTAINKSMLKHEIKNILVQFWIDKEILDSSALSLVLYIDKFTNARAWNSEANWVRKILI